MDVEEEEDLPQPAAITVKVLQLSGLTVELGSTDLSNVRADPEESLSGERREGRVCMCVCVVCVLHVNWAILSLWMLNFFPPLPSFIPPFLPSSFLPPSPLPLLPSPPLRFSPPSSLPSPSCLSLPPLLSPSCLSLPSLLSPSCFSLPLLFSSPLCFTSFHRHPDGPLPPILHGSPPRPIHPTRTSPTTLLFPV